jgi:peptide/nickel transport system substrate-binding protein
MFDLLTPAGEPSDPKIKTVKQIIPPLSMDTNMFSFVISNISVYGGTGSFPNGVPATFFNNTHARKAMAYSFNWSTYSEQAYFGESDYRKNWLTVGLYPDYYNDAIPGYFESLANAETELKAAIYTQGAETKSLWDWGFTFDLTYNTGNDIRKICCEMINSFFDVLSTYDGRTGPPFTINVREVDWTATIRGMTRRLAPMYDIGWIADFADADNFARTFMHSFGAFSYYEMYSASNGYGSDKDVLVDTAVLTPDGPARQALYDELAQLYYDDCPSFTVNNPRGRRWCQYWVKGWYYDALYMSQFYYSLWKNDDCWFDVSGTPIGISDGKLDMKDIAYLILHFNAKAPVPGKPTDPKWVGVYGANGAVDCYGDRVSNMKDIAGAIQHFGHKNGTSTP